MHIREEVDAEPRLTPMLDLDSTTAYPHFRMKLNSITPSTTVHVTFIWAVTFFSYGYLDRARLYPKVMSVCT